MHDIQYRTFEEHANLETKRNTQSTSNTILPFESQCVRERWRMCIQCIGLEQSTAMLTEVEHRSSCSEKLHINDYNYSLFTPLSRDELVALGLQCAVLYCVC